MTEQNDDYWIIRNSTAAPNRLYWDKTNGWWTADIGDATVFTDSERHDFDLPAGDNVEWFRVASWAPEQSVEGKWYRNQVRLATPQEAKNNAMDLFMRWTQSANCRATPATEPPNYLYTEAGDLLPLTTEPTEPTEQK